MPKNELVHSNLEPAIPTRTLDHPVVLAYSVLSPLHTLSMGHIVDVMYLHFSTAVL